MGELFTPWAPPTYGIDRIAEPTAPVPPLSEGLRPGGPSSPGLLMGAAGLQIVQTDPWVAQQRREVPTAGLDYEQLLPEALRQGIPVEGLGEGFGLLAPTGLAQTPREHRIEGLEERQLEAAVLSAEGKLAFEEDTFDDRVAQVATDLDNAVTAGMRTDQIITTNAPKALQAAQDFAVALSNPDLLIGISEAKLRTTYQELFNMLTWYAANPGQTPQTQAAAAQIAMAGARLDLAWQGYLNPIPTPAQPDKPPSPTTLLDDANAAAAKTVATFRDLKFEMTKAQAVAEINKHKGVAGFNAQNYIDQITAGKPKPKASDTGFFDRLTDESGVLGE